MRTCSICGEEFQTGAGLASHRRAKHARVKGPNRRAIDAVLAGLADPPDAATMQAARSIADSLDTDPGNAQMWKVYREVVAALLEGAGAGDETEDELQEMRGAPLGKLKAV